MKNKDGGPAFPQPIHKVKFDTTPTDFSESGCGGMSLRDWFAGQALAGYLADTRCPDRATPDVVAKWCYSNADAMLKARGVKYSTNDKLTYRR